LTADSWRNTLQASLDALLSQTASVPNTLTPTPQPEVLPERQHLLRRHPLQPQPRSQQPRHHR
jgi:hypothetical protein